MPNALTAADRTVRHHRRAVRFFWFWLRGATLTSLAGNITHALLTAPEARGWIAAAVAAVPPTVLLSAVHGIAVLAKTNASRAIYRLSVTATGALALGAFLLSSVALRDLAVMAGIAPRLAAALPLVIDLAVAVATAALVAVGDKPARRSRYATANATQSPRGTELRSRATARSNCAVPAPTDSVGAAPGAPPAATGAIAELAAELVTAKVTRQPVETVEAILYAHHNDAALNRIAADLGVHHSAVKRILDTSELRRQDLITTVR